MRPRQFPSSAAVGLAATTALTAFIGLAGWMAGPGSAELQAQGSLPTRLLQPADLIYQGSFSVPAMQDTTGLYCEWTQGVIAFNPANNSLFLVCHDWQQQVAEISIPALGGTATQLQSPRDAMEGRGSQISPVAGSTVKVGGMHVEGSQLILSAYVYYDASGSATSSHFVRSTNLSTPSVQGPYRVGSVYNTAFWAGYFAPIPSIWQAALGGDTLNGQCCLGIISRTSYGPSVSAVNKADLLAARNPTPATMLVGYPDAHQTLAAWDSTGPLFNGTTIMRGVLLPEATATVLFFGFHGMGQFIYQGGTTASPYEPHVWFYRAADLASVKAGVKQPWEVFPYATARLPGMPGPNIGGVALDATTGRLYVSENLGDGAKPKIHVFTINGSSGGSAPPPPPPTDTTSPTASVSAPLSGAIVSGSIQVSASASDNVGVVGVQFTLDGANYGAEDTSAPYQVSWSTLSVSNGSHSVRAVARDAAGNVGTSPAVTITVSNASSDTTPPTVGVTNPSAGATVSSTVSIAGSASDNVAVAGVRFTVDGVTVGSEDTSAPYSASWDTMAAANGSHTLTAVARDAAGNTRTSSAVTVTVSNTLPDPVVALTSPSTDSMVSGTVMVTATASISTAEIMGVRFLLDDVDLDVEDTTEPYQVAWPTTRALNGGHRLRAVARAGNGRTASSPAVTVTVTNTTSSPPSGTMVPVAPPLPAPSGTVVRVNSVASLLAAVSALSSNTTIVIAPGTYALTSTLWIGGSLSNVTIRGESDSRDDVVLVGRGMGVIDGSVPHGIWTGNGVTGLTIANLTIRDVYQHPLIFNGGTEAPRVYNVRLVNAGQQFIKASPDGTGGVDNGRVEYSILEYATTSVDNYTNGIDVHTGRDWVIRHNLFRRIRAPQGQLAGPAVLMWNGSSGTLVEGNVFIDCQREISLGLITRTPHDHTGGIVRNNFIVRSAGLGGDVAIAIFDSPQTKVLHNTVLLNGQYPNAIEYRFPDTTGVTILNNLSDGVAQARDGASATLTGNLWTAVPAWFVAPASGDLHLNSTATAAIDRANSSADAPRDFDNELRPVGSAADLGADEYSTEGAPGPVADTTAPTVAVATPTAGATVNGAVAVTATAADNTAVVGVQFTLDGAPLGPEDTSAPYQATWGTTGTSNGSHTLRAIARDAAGNSVTSAPVSVNVANLVADTAAPSVTITAPAGGATVSGSISVTAAASDNVGVAGVRFTLDGAPLGAEDLTSPYQVSWTTTGTAEGTHSLRALARDAAGNTTTSAAVTVTVRNVVNDTTSPTVVLTAPESGETVSGNANVGASASDNVGVVGVQFTLDGVNLGPEVTQAPYQMAWVTTGATNGQHSVRAIARDAAGNRSTSSSRLVTVQNTDTDTVRLSVTVVGKGSVTSAPSGISCSEGSGDCVEDYEQGATVGLTAAAASGWTFGGWSGACAGTAACSVAMTSSQSVTATFRQARQAESVRGDFDGDGQADLLWQHHSGSPYVWYMNGRHRRDGAYLSPADVDPDWQIVGVSDFDGDADSDLLWQHKDGGLSVWIMQGSTRVSVVSPTPSSRDSSWRVAATGDFNGDNKADIVWQQPTTGALSVWLMDGVTRLSTGTPSPARVSPEWRIAGTADLNKDGKTDILWQDMDSGRLYVWFMNGLNSRLGSMNPPRVDRSWRAVMLGDFNHDSQPDIVWMHDDTGSLYVWYLSGTRRIDGEYLSPSRVDPTWNIVGR